MCCLCRSEILDHLETILLHFHDIHIDPLSAKDTSSGTKYFSAEED